MSSKTGCKDGISHIQEGSNGHEDLNRIVVTEKDLRVAKEITSEGNECAKNGDWTKAIEYYTEAIK